MTTLIDHRPRTGLLGRLPAFVRRAPEDAGHSRADCPDPEDTAPVSFLPSGPWAFLWYAVRSGYTGRFALLATLTIAAQGVESVGPYVLSRLVNVLTGGGTGAEAFSWLALLAGLWLGSALLFRVYEMMDVHTSPRLRAVVQKRLFAYLMGHSPRYFQENFAGKLGQKIKMAGQACVVILNLLCLEALKILVVLVIGCTLLAMAHPFYAVILAGWAAVFLAVMAVMARRCVELSRKYSEIHSTSTGKLIDSITNADLVRAFAKLPHERRFQGGYLDQEAAASRRMRLFIVGMRLFQSMGMLALFVGLLTLAIQDTVAGTMAIGTFTMVFTLSSLIVQNVLTLSGRAMEFFEHTGTLTEALDLVTQPHEILDAPGAKPLAIRQGGIEFRHIHFAHADGTTVFHGLDLVVKPGEKVGLVGRSGAGKSTLIRLLRRQYEPQRGQILIDGQDMADVTWDSLNEAIAEVPQVPGIFHRPVRDNIRYARPDAPDDETIAAAIQAHCHEFISRRPAGYDTMVGEQGIKLSGGERQRLAIARALVKDARILVLDEATSALDSESEHAIQGALWQLMAGRTVIAIAHRLSTITGMDRIVVLDHGAIVEQGSHRELLKRGGAYARLWQRQVGGFLADD